MGLCHEDKEDEPSVCGGGGRLAGVAQTQTAFTGDSIPILAAEAQEMVKWLLALGLSLCLRIPLVTGSLVTDLFLFLAPCLVVLVFTNFACCSAGASLSLIPCLFPFYCSLSFNSSKPF